MKYNAYDPKTNKSKIKYKSLHDLALFVYNYVYSLNKKPSDIAIYNYESNRAMLEYKNSLLGGADIPKKKTRKISTSLEGQLSFFE